MTVEAAIEKAIEGGCKWKSINFAPALFLDRKFWQSFGKALGWGENDTAHRDEWLTHWHDFIDHLAEGGTAEEFFKELK